MKIQVLYILDCEWCVKTKKLVRESLKELGADADVEEILIDSDESARKYSFPGSPTVRIDGKDIQEKASKGRCLPCEELAGSSGFASKECRCGCRVYFFRGREYPYPPKEMIKESIRKSLSRG